MSSPPNRRSRPPWDALTCLRGRIAGSAGLVRAGILDFSIPYPLFTIHCYNNFMHQTLQSLAEFTAARLIGDGNLEITNVASIAHAQPGALVFVQDEKHLAQALASTANAVIAGEFAASSAGRKPLLIAAHPRLAFARAGKLLHPPRTYAAAVHPTAVVHT